MNPLYVNLWGQYLMVVGSVLYRFASNAAGNLAPFVGSASRVLINLIVVVSIFLCLKTFKSRKELLGKKPKYLIIWGMLGAATIFCFFQSLELVGVGVATFLLKTNGAFMVLLSPLWWGVRPPITHYLNAVICILGSFLLLPDALDQGWVGFVFGMLAGISSAFAYLVVGKKMNQESTLSIMFFWSIAGILLHIIVFPFKNIEGTSHTSVWMFILASSLISSIGQYWVTGSYKSKNNWTVGLISYSSCIFALILDYFLLNIDFSPRQMFGVLILFLANLSILFPAGFKLRKDSLKA